MPVKFPPRALCYENPEPTPGNFLLLNGLFLGRANDHERSDRSRNRSGNHEDAFLSAHLKDAEVLNSDALIAHVAWHTHVFPDTTRSRAVTNSAVSTMHGGTVTGGLTGKVVPFDGALETFTLRLADDVHELTDLKVCNRKRRWIRCGFTVRKAELADETLRCG